MVNIAPNFDVLKYTYNIDSLALQATTKLIRENIFHAWNGYIQAGLGAAVNRLSNYHENSPGSSSAAPMLSPFGDKNIVNPAASLGIGLIYNLKNSGAEIAFGYRYFYTGKGELGSSPAQQTHELFSLSPISYHVLMLSVSA